MCTKIHISKSILILFKEKRILGCYTLALLEGEKRERVLASINSVFAGFCKWELELLGALPNGP